MCDMVRYWVYLVITPSSLLLAVLQMCLHTSFPGCFAWFASSKVHVAPAVQSEEAGCGFHMNRLNTPPAWRCCWTWPHPDLQTEIAAAWFWASSWLCVSAGALLSGLQTPLICPLCLLLILFLIKHFQSKLVQTIFSTSTFSVDVYFNFLHFLSTCIHTSSTWLFWPVRNHRDSTVKYELKCPVD